MPAHLHFVFSALLVTAVQLGHLAGNLEAASAADKAPYPEPPAKTAKPIATPTATPTPSATKPAAPAAVAPKVRSVKTDVDLAVQARAAAVKAIPYIEKEGTAWINDRKCLSCHFAGYMLWSFNDAAAHGFDIDRRKLDEQITWSLEQTKGADSEGLAQTLLALTRYEAAAKPKADVEAKEKTAKLVASFRDQIIKAQSADGFWKAGGQLPSQKRPLSETTQVSTMLCILGLATLEPHAAADESRAKALAWLKKTPPNGAKPGESTEWYALRLVTAKRFGDAQEIATLRKQLLAAQHADGGWGWRLEDPSDAYGTGIALYALSLSGTLNTDPVIHRAWKYLVETQTDAGSWPVNGTKSDKKDKPHPMSTFWGTTWALLGLSHTLPPKTAAATTSAAPSASAR